MLPNPAQDAPDDSLWQPGSTRALVVDLGELAVRLGGVSSYDRRGEVLWWEDGRHGLADWDTISAINGASCVVSCDRTKGSGYCLRMDTGAAVGSSVRLTHNDNAILAGSIGIEEIAIISSALQYHYLYIDLYTGSRHCIFAMQIDQAARVIQYKDASLAWVTCYNYPTTFINGDIRRQLKIVADITTGLYKRLIFENIEIDLSAIPIYSVLNTSRAYLSAQIFHSGAGAATSSCIHNGTILTANEP
jgi:hypothetical protein